MIMMLLRMPKAQINKRDTNHEIKTNDNHNDHDNVLNTKKP